MLRYIKSINVIQLTNYCLFDKHWLNHTTSNIGPVNTICICVWKYAEMDYILLNGVWNSR